MLFFVFMFICTLLIPISLLITRYTCLKVSEINYVSGYRSALSVKNEATWKFAQKYCANICTKLFVPTLLLSFAVMPFTFNKSVSVIGWTGLVVVMIQMLSFFVIIYSTEKALKKEFNNEK